MTAIGTCRTSRTSLVLLSAVLFSSAASAQGRGGSNWTTYRGDAQRLVAGVDRDRSDRRRGSDSRPPTILNRQLPIIARRQAGIFSRDTAASRVPICASAYISSA